jgi:hypothetical protein
LPWVIATVAKEQYTAFPKKFADFSVVIVAILMNHGASLILVVPMFLE